ncbi:MAG: RluA family pseudouridine synthase [Bacteroides sp.]|nr:RluA family pseudouridine synthase [Bacteroides sp.]MCM1380103.1 RluA family pseudouridine synthase [Bacteroides sp.]MCM1445664.1 RluA family pseudouridine synthase [Prevotella sp.]
MDIVYEDNHLIVVNKRSGEIVQGDKSGDEPLLERVRQYIKETYAKPGNVFCGLVHRLDRPVAGLVVFAKTSKALSRMCEMFRNGDVHKTYWAITRNAPAEPQGELHHWITTVEKTNKSTAHTAPRPNAKEARLGYRVIGRSDRYNLLEVKLYTGRKHQIRVQLAAIGCPVKGDLKYGDKRSNSDGSISLMARHIEFIHPVSKQPISLTAQVPHDPLWEYFDQSAIEPQFL